MPEAWFKQDNSNLIDIPNYSLINVPRLNSGGSALYIHDSISFKIRNDLILTAQNTNFVPHSQSVFLEIVNSSNSKNIVVANIYRAHHTNIDLFNSDLSRCLDMISAENKLAYICGDFNLGFLKHDSDSKINDFLTNFLIMICSRLLIVLLESPLILLLDNFFLQMFLIRRINLVFVFLISLIIILFFKLRVRCLSKIVRVEPIIVARSLNVICVPLLIVLN